MTLPTPPRYVVLPSEVIEQAYAPDKPRRALLASFTRILSLAWESKYEKTPRLNEEELMAFLKLSRRQYFEQKADMELLGWLRSSHPVPGFVQFSFSRSIVASVSSQVPPAAQTPSEINRTDGAENTENRTIVVVVKESNDSELTDESITPVLNGEISAKNRTDENGEDEPFLPSVERILANTNLLFDGAVVMSRGLEGIDPRDVLRWCAYVYSQKRTMKAPGGVVRNKLKWNEKPPEWTADKWFETLPNNFLEALGLLESEPAAAEEQETKPEVLFSPLPVGSRLVASGSMDVPTTAWQATKLQLEMQMTRNLYELWVKDTQAVRYDGNVLTVAAENPEAQSWLSSRLTSTVERLLIGILNAEVNVKFVVAETVNV